MDARLLLLPSLLLLAACGQGAPDALAGPDGERYEARGTVLESPEHGPELCLGGVAESLPPQCSGVPLAGWDWSAVEDAQSERGTTWGDYEVVGSFDGTTLTVTEPPRPAGRPEPVPVDPVDTPCPEPPGGWQVADETRTDETSLHDAIARARAEADHAGVWIDHLAEPTEQHDGARTVLNAAFTGDLARHERDLRAVWGGPLCVVQHERTLSELMAVQDELMGGVAAELGMTPTFGAVDEPRGVVQLGVVAVTPEQRAALDQRYGAGTVDVAPGLVMRPVEG